MYLDEVNFSKLFLDKHGKKIFDEITSIIEKEKARDCDDNYIEIVFKVAFTSYFGLDNQALNRMLEDIKCNIDIKDIKNNHKISIKTIQEYIKMTSNEISEM